MLWMIATRALGWLRKVNPLVFVIAGLAFAAWLGWHRADHWHDEAQRRSQVIATMQATSKAEQARATAEHAAAALHEKELNDAADRRVELARASDRAALGAYIDRLRASIGASQRAQVSPAGQADVAQGDHGPGGDSVVVQTLTADLGKCDRNTRRLLEANIEAHKDDAQ